MTGLRTLLIGIDAACLRLLEPQFERGTLPHLRSIVDRGVAAPLESQLPPWTPSAWPSLSTGTNPGKHGVFSFLRYDGYDWDLVDATDVRELTLWEMLDHYDRSSVVVNVPVTHPPPAIDGAVVPGFVGPTEPTCHPSGLLDELRTELGDYRVYGSYEFAADPPRDERVAEYCELTRMRGQAFRYLAERFDPAFGFVQFQQTDTVVHDFPGDERALESVYEAVDAQIGAILDECDPDTVFVASDHGIGPYDGQEFRVNEFLRREGYLETTSGGESPSWVPLWESQLGGARANSDGRLDRLARLAADALPMAQLGRTLETLGVADVVPFPDGLFATGETPDFAASTAYMRLPVELGVRINLAGREPEGVVAPDEYEAVREELIERLRAVRTPDGRPVFDDVLPREAVFHGPHVDQAVDIVTIPADFEQFPASQIGGGVFGPMNEPWNHKQTGVFAAAGRAVDADAPIDHPHLLDVAPTVLASLGVPIGERLDSNPLPIVSQTERDSYPRPDRRPASETSDPAVTARLGALGYLDN